MNKKLISVVSVFWLFSQSAFAEMKQIDDSDLSEVTGQAGLTIDIEMGIEIGEFMYKDGGSIVMQGLRFGGMDALGVGTAYDADNTSDLNLFNNARVHVDVASAGEQFNWAWSEWTGGIPASNAGTNYLCRECVYSANDGDLIIHGSVTDIFEVSRSYQAVDFGIELDKFAIKDSSYVAGDDIVDNSGTSTTAQSTTILSNMKMEGYMGGFDWIIENNGNGFTNNIADSKIKINTFFEITDMEYDFNIVGIRYEDMKIHNHRGNLDYFNHEQNNTGSNAGTSEGFAQSNVHIYAVQDGVLRIGSAANVNGSVNPADYVDGIGLKTRFRGDMDIGHLSFGDTGRSIGEQYWTDMDFNTTMVLSAH